MSLDPWTPEAWTRLLQEELAKRGPNLDPAQRWTVIQEFLTLAEQQATVRRNTLAACLAKQVRILQAQARRAAEARP